MIAAAAVKLMATTEAGTTTPAVLMITDGIRKGLIQANSPLLQSSSKVKHRLLKGTVSQDFLPQIFS
jgi:hypothetical protein